MPRSGQPLLLFGARSSAQSSTAVFQLCLRSDASLEISSSSKTAKPVVMQGSAVQKGRWTHIAFVHYPTRATSPTCRKSLHPSRRKSSDVMHFEQGYSSTATKSPLSILRIPARQPLPRFKLARMPAYLPPLSGSSQLLIFWPVLYLRTSHS